MTTPTVLHAADYKVEAGVTCLPLYMTPLLEDTKQSSRRKRHKSLLCQSMCLAVGRRSSSCLCYVM